MKTAKRIVAALLPVIMLHGCTIYPSVPETLSPEEDLPEQTIVLPAHETQEQTTEADYDPVFEQMCSGLSRLENSVTIDESVNGEILDEAFYRIRRERPELFWICGYSAEYNETEAHVEFTVLDDLGTQQLSRMTAELENTAEKIAGQAAMYPSDYDRVLFVHDYIVEHTEYDSVGAASNLNGLWGTAYGCLVDGNAVCQGYAEAFLLLMNKLGIPAGICTGMTERGSHAWNYVYVNGAYYWLDATWDDPSFTDGEGGGLRHTYFLINDEQLRRSRTIDTENGAVIPACNYLDANYFVRNGNYLTGYQFQDIDVRLSRALNAGCMEVMFDSQSACETAVTALFEENEIWKASIFLDRTGTVWYSMDDDMYVLRIEFAIDD